MKDKSIPLQLNRMRQITLEVYKTLSNQCPSYLYDMIKPIKETGHNLRKMNVNAPSIKYGKNSFKYRGSVLWNDLPKCMQTSENYNVFKKLVSSWNGKKCRCAICVDVRTKQVYMSHTCIYSPEPYFMCTKCLPVLSLR